MTTTIGQVVSQLFRRYQRMYRDEELAALATAVVLGELFASRSTAAGYGAGVSMSSSRSLLSSTPPPE